VLLAASVPLRAYSATCAWVSVVVAVSEADLPRVTVRVPASVAAALSAADLASSSARV
jgi:hypothetical protein